AAARRVKSGGQPSGLRLPPCQAAAFAPALGPVPAPAPRALVCSAALPFSEPPRHAGTGCPFHAPVFAPAFSRTCARHSFRDTTLTGRPVFSARIASSTARAVSSDVRHG